MYFVYLRTFWWENTMFVNTDNMINDVKYKSNFAIINKINK